MLLRTDRTLREIERLYNERLEHFVQVARAITSDSELARDAVQDAFASVVKARRDFRGDGPLEAFVWTAVVNAARRTMRRPLVEVHELAVNEVPVPDQVEQLAPHVAALPERQRLVIFLRYYADLDYRTIGAILDIAPDTVGPTLAAAHASLRRSLSKEVRR